ncbi:MAG: SUMF1/EgtB/PvdO family nonheme iron enzyme [Polyangiaceae bacterium]|nr:SUMF1/EgtB/PvdO family nonheme iron enzyme [Polyangiaceae bacterium]
MARPCTVMALALALGAGALGCEQQTTGGGSTRSVPAAAASGASASDSAPSAGASAAEGPAAVSASAAASASAPSPDASAVASASAAATDAPTPPEGMVYVPEGIFVMGSTYGRGDPEEWPAHEGVVPAFFMDRTEVTMKAYKACVDAGACKAPRTSQRFCNAAGPDPFAADKGPRDEHPVNCVSLYDAIDYCKFAGKRVPTEREWEYAARGGAERRTFSWGEELPTEKTSCYHHPGGSCPVASFKPGAFGLYDMSGNVWEWVQSTFVPYPSRIDADVPDPKNVKQQFVYRGGSWSRRFAKWLRNAIRNRVEPADLHASLGIRCVKTVEPRRCPPETAPKGEGCERVSGTPLCEPGYAWKEGKCVASKDAPWLGGKQVQTGELAAMGEVPEQGDDAGEVEGTKTTRSRTAKYDEDCQKNWPAFPSSYLFTGGGNYWDRKKVILGMGCTPRDMGGTWTSACCKQ